MRTSDGCFKLELKTWGDPKTKSKAIGKTIEGVFQTEFHESLSSHEKSAVVRRGSFMLFKCGKTNCQKNSRK